MQEIKQQNVTFSARTTHLLVTEAYGQCHHVFPQRHHMQAMLVDCLADPPVLLQQGLGGVLVVAKVLAGHQSVGILQPGHQVVHLRGVLGKVQCLLQVAKALRSLVLEALPLALHLHDAFLDPRRAKAFFAQDLFSSLYGVLEEAYRAGILFKVLTLFSRQWSSFSLFFPPVCRGDSEKMQTPNAKPQPVIIYIFSSINV